MRINLYKKYAKNILLALWWASVIWAVWYYIIHPEAFTSEKISDFFMGFWRFFLVVYMLVSVLRGLTLIPSTPFVLAWVLLFPGELLKVYIISLIWILLSATMIYFFSREMDFEKIILWKHKKIMKIWEKWISKYWFYTVLVWSFVIIVPTDIICYIAGTMKMRYAQFITAVAIWEWLICIILIWWWDVTFEFLKQLFI